MSYFKEVRIKDAKKLKDVASRNCAVGMAGGHIGKVCAHHLKTKGAGGGDEENNLIPLCAAHHTEIHSSGAHAFFDRYGCFLDREGWDKMIDHLNFREVKK